MKKGSAFLGLALATMMGISLIGISEAQATPRIGPYPITYVVPVKDRNGKPLIRRGRQAYDLKTELFDPSNPKKSKLIKKWRFTRRVNKNSKITCSKGCPRN